MPGILRVEGGDLGARDEESLAVELRSSHRGRSGWETSARTTGRKSISSRRGGTTGGISWKGRSAGRRQTGCNTTGLTLPIKEYTHALGTSITGGYVYRGYRRPSLAGAYVYADYGAGASGCSGTSNGAITADSLLIAGPFLVSSFGTDQLNELYIVSYSASASIYRFTGSGPTSIGDPPALPARFALDQNYPNPVQPVDLDRVPASGCGTRHAQGVRHAGTGSGDARRCGRERRAAHGRRSAGRRVPAACISTGLRPRTGSLAKSMTLVR